MQVPREGLQLKLERLSQSQQSIESVSSFCIFYHKDARGVVQVWEAEFYKAPNDRKLALLYLANHILQEGRKKGMAFQEEYFKVLPKAVAHMVKHGDDKAKKSMTRLVTVWEERRVFGSRQIKSFRDAMGLPSDPKPTAAAGSGGAAGAGSSSHAAAAAAAIKLGPVGDALSLVLSKAADAAAKGQEFTNSWSQGVLTSAGLPEVTASHGKLTAYSAALQQEVAARQAALTALNAELAKQTAEVSRAESQLQAVAGHKQQLDARLTLLTSQAMASLGGLFQQQQNGAAAGAGAGPAGNADVGGSPQAPDLELDDEPAVPAVQQQQHSVVTHDLQTLLMNPEMLSAAITSSIPGAGAAGAAPAALPPQAGMQPAAVPASMGFGGPGVMLQIGGAAGGVQLQLPSGPVPAAAGPAGGQYMYAAAPPVGFSAAGDGTAGFGAGAMQGAFLQQGGFGGMSMLQQQQSGFADEADDPYNPEFD